MRREPVPTAYRLLLVSALLAGACSGTPAPPAPPVAPPPPAATAAPETRQTRTNPSFDGAQSGQQAPLLALLPVGGGATWTLADNLHPSGAKGSHAALIAIMASWCGYCTQSLPTLVELQNANPDLAVVTVTVDAKPDAQKAERDKVRAAGLTGPVLVGDDAMQQAWMGTSTTLPRYVFVNANGKITNQDRGFGAKVKPLMAGQARRALAAGVRG